MMMFALMKARLLAAHSARDARHIGRCRDGCAAVAGIGALLAIGASALIGGLIGGATGGVLAGLIDSGFHEEQIKRLSSHLKRGGRQRVRIRRRS